MFRIDQKLYQALQSQAITVKLHSSFQNALNLQCEDGLITFLGEGKCLQPMSILFDRPFDFRTCRIPQGTLYLSQGGLSDGTGYFFVFSDLQARDLTLCHESAFGPQCARQIRSFLEKQTEKGIHGIIEGNVDDVYSRFLEPRIQEFRTAVKTRDHENILNAVKKIAGCGPGLTPSSDDFLCGYISVMPRTEAYSGIRKVIADTAAAKTNDISASLLKNAEKGYFSEDILELFLALKANDRMKTNASIQRVADFGSSSGCDFLTGMYYGILDAERKGR